MNDAPVATAQSVSAAEDTAVAITLAGTDMDGDALTFTVVTPSTHGALTGTEANLTYSPVANYNGPDSFTFKANDGTIDSVPATVSITVTAVNDAPVFDAIADLTVLENAGTKGLSVTGIDPGGGAHEADQTVTLAATSSNPALVPNPTVTGLGSTRTISFAPAANGTVTITVTAQDGKPTGGTFNGGVYTSTRTFGIAVTPSGQSGQGCGCSGGGGGGGPFALTALFLTALALRGRKARH